MVVEATRGLLAILLSCFVLAGCPSGSGGSGGQAADTGSSFTKDYTEPIPGGIVDDTYIGLILDRLAADLGTLRSELSVTRRDDYTGPDRTRIRGVQTRKGLPFDGTWFDLNILPSGAVHCQGTLAPQERKVLVARINSQQAVTEAQHYMDSHGASVHTAMAGPSLVYYLRAGTLTVVLTYKVDGESSYYYVDTANGAVVGSEAIWIPASG
jgi:hypothetical protein